MQVVACKLVYLKENPIRRIKCEFLFLLAIGRISTASLSTHPAPSCYLPMRGQTALTDVQDNLWIQNSHKQLVLAQTTCKKIQKQHFICTLDFLFTSLHWFLYPTCFPTCHFSSSCSFKKKIALENLHCVKYYSKYFTGII